MQGKGMRQFRAILVVITLGIFVAACGGAAPTPTANALATQTRVAELAQLATLTVPTMTPTPANTPTIALPTRASVTQLPCRMDLPIKALTLASGAHIYYLPDHADYDRVIWESCFADAQTAEAAGFRRAPSNTLALSFTPTPRSLAPTPLPSPTPVPGCSTSDGKKVYDLLKQFLQEWDDALKLADSTPRISLSPLIAHRYSEASQAKMEEALRQV
jgi:hypothetical protein